jgi:hemerythrin
MPTWTDDLKTGVEIIDLQHRQLFEYINDLEGMLGETLPPAEYCDHLMTCLQAHITAHFGFEENCMERMRCPMHERNRQEHRELQAFFDQADARYRLEGPSRELLVAMHERLMQWAFQHIVKIDCALRPCVQAAARTPAL